MAPRSRTGCLTCRSRKLKCGEEKPVCANCVKAHRECVLSQSLTFRHQQNPSMNGHDQGSLKSFYGYKETFAKSTTWCKVPTDLTFVHTNNPYEDEEYIPETPFRHHSAAAALSAAAAAAGPSSFPAYATRSLEALSAVATDQYTYAPQPPTVDTHSGSGLDIILNPSSQQVSPVTGDGQGNIDPQLHAASPVEQTPVLTSPSHVALAYIQSSRYGLQVSCLDGTSIFGENGEVSVEYEARRTTVLQLLRGIERDMGWAAEYRVRGLMELWGIDPDVQKG